MYNKLHLKNGDVLSDIHLNHLENAIDEIVEETSEFKNKLIDIATAKGLAINEEMSFNDIANQINLLGARIYHNHDVENELIDIRETCPSGCIQLVCTDEGTGRVRFTVWTSDNSQYSVDWGDGKSNIYNSGAVADHTYAKGAGQAYKENATQFVATISAAGGNVINRFLSGEKPQIIWFASKDIYFTNLDSMFATYNYADNYGCHFLKYVDIIGGALTSQANTSAQGAFRGCYSLERVTGTMNLTGATNLSLLFNGCKALKEVPEVILLGTEGINADGMFLNCNELEAIPFDFDFSGLTNITNIFGSCYKLAELPDNIDLRSCTMANYAFQYCKALIYMPELKNSNRITASAGMFQYSGIEEMYPILDLSSSTNTVDLFRGCTMLREAPVTLKLDNTGTIQRLFETCTSMVSAPSSIYAPKATNAQYTFSGCNSLRKAPTSINLPVVENAVGLFQNCSSMTHGPDELLLDTAKDINNLFSGCITLQKGAPIYAPEATNITSIFYNCSSMVSVAEEYDFPNAIHANNLFQGCSSLEVAPRLNLPVAQNTASIFNGCSRLRETKPYSFPNTNTVNGFYRSCSLLEHVEQLEAPKATTWSEVYRGSQSLVSITTMSGPLATTLWYTLDASPYLHTLPEVIDMSSVTDTSGWCNSKQIQGSVTFKGLKAALTLNGNPGITSIRLQNQNTLCQNLNFSSNGLDTEAINTLFGDLVRPTATRNINVAGNPGASTCNASIATAKGWTVTK